MWRLRLPSAPRVNLRRIATFMVTGLLVASFATIFASSTPVYAAPAEWSGDTLTYQQNQYTLEAGANIPPGEIAGHLPYIWVDDSSTPQIAHVIVFDTDQPQTAKTAEYLTFDFEPPDSYTNPSQIEIIDVTIDPTGGPVDNDNSYANTCNSNITKGVGWILCPISNWIAGAVDGVYSIINDFLEVPAVTADSDTGIYELWRVLLAIANVCFAIVFMVIIYSHLTSVGFSNYNIKSILPRLLIGAVLVNISFWVCALAIDISNTLGYSIHAVLVSIRDNMSTGADVDWSGLTAFILAGGSITAYLGFAASAGGSGMSMGFLIVAALAGVAFAVFVAFVILAARQAIITVLLILSPLAFVAFVLPSTQGWFDRWRKSFTTLLMFFPLFAVLFGGSGVAGAAIMNAADGRLHIALIGLATQFVPLVLTPLLIQFSSGLLGRIAGIANDSTRGITDRAKNWAHANADHFADEKRARWAEHARAGNKRRFLNPVAMTGYAIDQGKRSRDRAKSINEGRLDKANEASWQQRLDKPRRGLRGHSDNRYRQRYLDTQDLEKRANTYKEHLDSQANEDWQRNLSEAKGDYRDLRDTRRRTHLTKERADTLDKRMTAQDQRQSDELIANAKADSYYGQIRQARADTVEDTKHSQFQSSRVEAEGERAYHRAFQDGEPGSRDLRKQLVTMEQTKKESATIESDMQKRAEAHWDKVSAKDDSVKALRLSEAASADSSRLAAAEWNKIVEDIRLKGAESTHVPKGAGLSSSQLQIRRAAGNIMAQSALAVAAEQAVTKLKTTHESRAQTTYIQSAEGQRLNRAAQAAQDTLATAEAQEAAIVQELRTEKGAENLHGEDAVIAAELRAADVAKRVYSRRTEQATDVAAQEFAGLVKDDQVIPGTTDKIVAASAGIAGRSGETQTKAHAHQTIVAAAEKAIAAETTLFSQVKEGKLLADKITDDDGNDTGEIGLGSDDILDEPAERIAALGSSIAKRRHMMSHIKLWHRMSQLRKMANDEYEVAKSSGDQDAIKKAQEKISKVKDLQQQVMGDKTKTPFGIGDQAQGDANVGIYEGDPIADTRDRIMTHLSVKRMAEMDPDDMKIMLELARADKLNKAELGKISSVYEAWQKDPNYKSALEDKHRAILDPIQRDYHGQEPDYPDINKQNSYGDMIAGLTKNPEPTREQIDNMEREARRREQNQTSHQGRGYTENASGLFIPDDQEE